MEAEVLAAYGIPDVPLLVEHVSIHFGLKLLQVLVVPGTWSGVVPHPAYAGGLTAGDGLPCSRWLRDTVRFIYEHVEGVEVVHGSGVGSNPR